MLRESASAAYLRKLSDEQLGLLWIVSSERLRGCIREELAGRAGAVCPAYATVRNGRSAAAPAQVAAA